MPSPSVQAQAQTLDKQQAKEKRRKAGYLFVAGRTQPNPTQKHKAKTKKTKKLKKLKTENKTKKLEKQNKRKCGAL